MCPGQFIFFSRNTALAALSRGRAFELLLPADGTVCQLTGKGDGPGAACRPFQRVVMDVLRKESNCHRYCRPLRVRPRLGMTTRSIYDSERRHHRYRLSGRR